MFLGIRHPRSTRLNLADLSDAPAHEITSPALSNQGAGPMKPAVGQVKWLVAALAIRRSHCQRYARPLHPTTQTWSDRELRPHQAKLVQLPQQRRNRFGLRRTLLDVRGAVGLRTHGLHPTLMRAFVLIAAITVDPDQCRGRPPRSCCYPKCR